jgi:hypothetical protein
VHRIGRGRGVVPAAVAVAVAVAVGLCGPHAANAQPRLLPGFTNCAPITLRLGTTPKRLRIERRGVTCARAHRLIVTWLRRVAPRDCALTDCNLTLAGGWQCQSFQAALGRMLDDALMGCTRSATSRFFVVPVTATVTGSGFLVATAPAVACVMSNVHGAFCENEQPPHNDIARLAVNGTSRVCRSTVLGVAGGCQPFPFAGFPTFHAGRRVTVGPFRCTVVAAGVRCVVRASGKGFEMTGRTVTAVGGATLLPTST